MLLLLYFYLLLLRKYIIYKYPSKYVIINKAIGSSLTLHDKLLINNLNYINSMNLFAHT